MAAKNFYDAVLVGLDLPTLLAGALLSKRGFRVLLLGQGVPWPSYEVRGVRFPRAPFALTSPDSPALARVFSELALRPLMQRRIRPQSPAFQAVLPGHRIDFGADAVLLGRELDREFPGVRRFVEELSASTRESDRRLDGLLARDLMWPPDRFLERREFFHAALDTPLGVAATASSKWAARTSLQPPLPDREPEHSELRADLGSSAALARIFASCIEELDGSTAQNPSATFSPRTARLLFGLLGSAQLDEGGLSGLFELLIDCIHTHNGSLRRSERVDGLTIKRDALHSLHLFPSDEEIGYQQLLWGLPVARLSALLPNRDQLAPLFAEVGEPRAVSSRFTLNLLLRAEAIPDGMAERVLLLGDEALWLETQRTTDSQRRVLSVEARIPLREGVDRSERLATQRERMLEQLSVLSPFLCQHIELIDSPHDGRPVEDVLSGSKFLPEDGSRRGADTMETVYAFPRPRLQGTAALSVRTPIERLLLCNTQVVPGLGLEGTFLTAWSAARAVTRSLNRDWMNRGRWTKVEL